MGDFDLLPNVNRLATKQRGLHFLTLNGQRRSLLNKRALSFSQYGRPACIIGK
jgi:hypothetical protein